jgi:hypothetical protein
MATSRFRFRNQEGLEIGPSAWVELWAPRYDVSDIGYNRVYFELIEKPGKLSGGDFELVGKLKESCLKFGTGRWKTGTPAGYDVWMQVKAALPECPEQDAIAAFLDKWSKKTFQAGKINNKGLSFRWGLSRAPTHFAAL